MTCTSTQDSSAAERKGTLYAIEIECCVTVLVLLHRCTWASQSFLGAHACAMAADSCVSIDIFQWHLMKTMSGGPTCMLPRMHCIIALKFAHTSVRCVGLSKILLLPKACTAHTALPSQLLPRST